MLLPNRIGRGSPASVGGFRERAGLAASLRAQRWLLGSLFASLAAGFVNGCSAQHGRIGAADAGAVTDADADAGGEPVADAGTCHARSVAGFQLPSSVPVRAKSDACEGDAGAVIQAYGDACLGHAATYATCAAFQAPTAGAAAACYSCLVTPESPEATSYGVVVAAGQPVINYSSCIAAVDPTSAGRACALSFYVAASCVNYACQTSCPVRDQASSDAYYVCTIDAITGPCIGYWLEAQSCRAAELGDGGTAVASICFPDASTSAEGNYLAIARYFCGQ